MRHFLLMALFAALAAIVFGAISKDSTRDRWIYGAKVFAEFMVIGLTERNQFLVFLFEVGEIDECERLERRAETILQLATVLRDSANQT